MNLLDPYDYADEADDLLAEDLLADEADEADEADDLLADEADEADDLLAEDLLAGEADEAGMSRLADVLRQALREEYADASDEEMGDALANVFDAMSPAESLNFASALSALSGMGKSARQLLSDPTVGPIVRAALPIAGGAAGTALGGPAGTALGAQLGSVVTKALPSRAPARAPRPRRAAARAATARAARSPAARPVRAPTAAPTAAFQALQAWPQLMGSLLAAALGPYGRQRIDGIPVAQLLGTLSRSIGQAAADADELMYLDQYSDEGESLIDSQTAEADRSLYASLLDADNLELAEALEDEEGGW